MSIDLPGFADPVLDSQRAFRAVLDALARPGTIREAGAGLVPPAPLTPAAAAMLLTLVDAETTLFLDADFAPARDWIAFHCGAGIVPDAADADFILAATCPNLAALRAGADDTPEEGATVILQTAGLGTGRRLVLAGPGLPAPAPFAVDGLPADFTLLWAANHAGFPRGVDLILCAGAQLAALPRSLRITEG